MKLDDGEEWLRIFAELLALNEDLPEHNRLPIDHHLIVRAIKDEAASFPRYQSLVEDAEQLWQHFLEFAPTFGTRERHVVLVAISWLASAYRHARSTFLLTNQGFYDSAQSTSRTALEHSLYLSLMAGSLDNTEFMDRMEKEMRDSTTTLLHEARTQGMESTDFMDVLLTTIPESSPAGNLGRISRVQAVCNHLETGALIYTHYRALSLQVHPCIPGTQGYMFRGVLADLTGEGVPTEPLYPPNNLGPAFALYSCVWAGFAMDAILELDYFSPVVATMATKYNLTPLRRL